MTDREQCGTCQCRWCGSEYDGHAIEDFTGSLIKERDELQVEVDRAVDLFAHGGRIERERDEALAELERSRASNASQRRLRLDATERAREFEGMFNDAVGELAKLRQRIRWIPVKERLPEADGIYAVKLRGGVLGRLTPGDWWAAQFFADAEYPEWFGVSSPVTHWMALPELTEGV